MTTLKAISRLQKRTPPREWNQVKDLVMLAAMVWR